MLKVKDYFDISHTDHKKLFDDLEYVWDILKKLKSYIEKHSEAKILGKVPKSSIVEGKVYIGKGTIIEPGVYIKGPAIIGNDCEIRHGTYIRGNVIIGNNAVLGNSCEFKHSFLFDEVDVPHLAYVGDSILGWKSHLGAGVVLSNIKMIRSNVILEINGKKYDSGLIKFGAIIGDNADVGCNSVLNPGSIIGKRSIIYTNVSWRGYLPSDSIVKLRQEHQIVVRK